MGEVSAGFAANAAAATRTTAVHAIATLHEMNMQSTKSLTYDPQLGEFGRNIKKEARIGPSAFGQDISWLAAVVYHELAHSDQFDIYAKEGVELPASEARSETERRLVALDEVEAFFLTHKERGNLGLSKAQADYIWRRVVIKAIDVDDPDARTLIGQKRFGEARLLLIGKLKSK
jgi:hypothetical protein